MRVCFKKRHQVRNGDKEADGKGRWEKASRPGEGRKQEERKRTPSTRTAPERDTVRVRTCTGMGPVFFKLVLRKC